MLRRIAELDPEPANLEAALASLIDELGRLPDQSAPWRLASATIGKAWRPIPIGSSNSGMKRCRSGKGNDVGRRFPSYWLGRKPALPPEVEEARTELTRLGEQKPVLADLAAQLSDCLQALYAEPLRVVIPSLTRRQPKRSGVRCTAPPR